MRISVSLDQVTALTEAMRILETGFAFVMLFFLLRVKVFGALSLILNRRHLRGPDVRGIAKPTPGTRTGRPTVAGGLGLWSYVGWR